MMATDLSLGDRGTIAGVQTPDRQTLITYIHDFVSALGCENSDAPRLRIVLPCGKIREYATQEEIPVRSTQCNCGEVDYEHWFVRYEKEAENGS